MKKSSLAALLISAVVAVPAFAAGYSPAPSAEAPATQNVAKTRAEVKAELAQARVDGELSLNPNAPAYPQQFATGGYTVPVAQISFHHFGSKKAQNVD